MPTFDYVEDIIEIVCENLRTPSVQQMLSDPWFSSFVSNIHGWVFGESKPLTTEQAKIVLRILSKTKPLFLSLGITPAAILSMQQVPRYRRTPTLSSVMPKEVRYVGGNYLAFRFKRNDIIIDDIKSMKRYWMVSSSIVYDHILRLWMVPVTYETIGPIIKLISKHRFSFDDAVAEYLTDAHNAMRDTTSVLNADHCVIMDNDLLAQWVTAVLVGKPT